MGLADALAGLCAEAFERLPEPFAAEAATLGARLRGPLRVAIAGRVKAGKSTLLNALVGERMAPTDAGECTRLVTWYRRADSYHVEALLRDASVRSVRFRREDDALHVELGELPAAAVERLDVQWPSARLAGMTLIDTPGLASVRKETSARTVEFLAPEGERTTDADAVVYLMRHVHRRDVEFLDAFMDRTVTQASPINAIAVLARADEIGGGRLDALDSAARIAARYRTDPTLRTLCSVVLPVAGLLAEAGTTLREDEYRALGALAAADAATLNTLLVTADRFVAAGVGPLTIESRHALLQRMGLFGVRFAVDRIRSGAVSGSPDLAAAMVKASGIGELRSTLAEQFLPRARVLQSRAVLGGLQGLSRRLAAADGDFSRWLDDRMERIEAAARELGELRLLHLAMIGDAFGEEEREEIRRLVLAAASGDTASGGDVRAAATAGVERWRMRASDPRNDPETVEACELAARVYEGMAADAAGR
jgi:hypothetical protein